VEDKPGDFTPCLAIAHRSTPFVENAQCRAKAFAPITHDFAFGVSVHRRA
jgi:hypothetical protein